MQQGSAQAGAGASNLWDYADPEGLAYYGQDTVPAAQQEEGTLVAGTQFSTVGNPLFEPVRGAPTIDLGLLAAGSMGMFQPSNLLWQHTQRSQPGLQPPQQAPVQMQAPLRPAAAQWQHAPHGPAATQWMQAAPMAPQGQYQWQAEAGADRRYRRWLGARNMLLVGTFPVHPCLTLSMPD
jgi:hypothetical protein